MLGVKEGFLADGKIIVGDRIERLNGMEIELLVKGLSKGKLEEMLSERPLRLTLLRDRTVDPERYPCGEFMLRNTAGVCLYPEPEEPGFRTAERRVSWNHRRPLLIEEISAVDPDIICLQDVDHINDMNDSLTPLGYESWYLQLLHHPINSPRSLDFSVHFISVFSKSNANMIHTRTENSSFPSRTKLTY